MENDRYDPAGKRTVPPPADAAASMALLMAAVSMVLPSPVAPNFRTSKIPPSGAPAACALGALAARATPTPANFRNLRRSLALMGFLRSKFCKGRATQMGHEL